MLSLSTKTTGRGMTIDSDSIRRAETSSDRRTEKAIESERIARATAEFLKAGGKIEKLEPGESRQDFISVMVKGRSVWKNRRDTVWRLNYQTGPHEKIRDKNDNSRNRPRH